MVFLPKLLATTLTILPIISTSTATATATTRPLSTISQGFVEDNDLWKFDNPSFTVNITEEQFNNVINTVHNAMLPMAKANNEELKIGGFWQNTTVNAYAVRNYGEAIITVYGGIARRPELTVDGFALVVCHEIGHIFGGKPLKIMAYRMSVEGQSDYFGAQECLRKVLPNLPEIEQSEPASPYIESVCRVHRNTTDNEEVQCRRELLAAESVGKLLSFLRQQPVPNLETPDPKVVNRTLQSYPETIQCRLDTYRTAILGEPRPKCWFKR